MRSSPICGRRTAIRRRSAKVVSIDRGDPKRNIVFVGLGGLGLPDRDNYLVDNPRNLEMRARYLDYVAFLLGKAGHAIPRPAAEAVYALEKKMAAAMWDRRCRAQPGAHHQPDEPRRVRRRSLGPSRWSATSRGGRLLPTDRFNVAEIPPTAEEIAAHGLTPARARQARRRLSGDAELIMATPLDTWKAWMTARLLSANAGLLPSDIDDANFAFYGKYLQGREKQRDRWQRAIGEVEGSIGEALGKVYVERHFPASSKAAMEELVGNLRLAMAENLKSLAWMTPATRDRRQGQARRAFRQDRLSGQVRDLRRPGRSSRAIRSRNRLAAADWQWAKDLSDLRKPVDRSKWLLTPQTVNAYYMPTANDMAYPAAYLQPPNFNATADPAVNYGAIGATIGHEIGHGFDDKGSRYDGRRSARRTGGPPEDKATFEKLGDQAARAI